MKISFFQSIVSAVILTPLLLLSMHVAGAQVMTSPNYQIQSDSVNAGGGLSSSNNYFMESTVGEVSTGDSDSISYSLRAGYQQMHEVYLALSAVGSVSLSPAIPGVTGGIANGIASMTVTTDSLSGYQLTIQAGTSPAMQKGPDTIADYSPVTSDPDYTFVTGVTDAHLAYTPEGADVAQRFLNSGVTCNSGSSNDISSCWDGLSTTAVVIAQSAGSNHPVGTETTVRFRVGIGNSVVQAAGNYVATTTVTALPL